MQRRKTIDGPQFRKNMLFAEYAEKKTTKTSAVRRRQLEVRRITVIEKADAKKQVMPPQ